jgi:D-tyrosyl-tRNA(Tyr) deacylase
LKALLQRVSRASVSVDGEVIGAIGSGRAVLVGVAGGDTYRDVAYLAAKMVKLRIFADSAGKFNLSALDVGAELLLVSQFTLVADTSGGLRPSFTSAAPPAEAEALFDALVAEVRQTGLRIATGQFAAHMLVELCNDGPVTFMLDSRRQ